MSSGVVCIQSRVSSILQGSARLSKKSRYRQLLLSLAWTRSRKDTTAQQWGNKDKTARQWGNFGHICPSINWEHITLPCLINMISAFLSYNIWCKSKFWNKLSKMYCIATFYVQFVQFCPPKVNLPISAGPLVSQIKIGTPYYIIKIGTKSGHATRKLSKSW